MDTEERMKELVARLREKGRNDEADRLQGIVDRSPKALEALRGFVAALPEGTTRGELVNLLLVMLRQLLQRDESVHEFIVEMHNLFQATCNIRSIQENNPELSIGEIYEQLRTGPGPSRMKN